MGCLLLVGVVPGHTSFEAMSVSFGPGVGGGGGWECGVAHPCIMARCHQNPFLTSVQSMGQDEGDLLGPVLWCDSLRSDTFMVLCLGRLQSGLGYHRPVLGALQTKAFLLRIKYPWAIKESGFESQGGFLAGCVCVGKAQRAL